MRARGYGTKRLGEIAGAKEGREAVMIELSLMVCGLASLLPTSSYYLDDVDSLGGYGRVAPGNTPLPDRHLLQPTYSEAAFLKAGTWFFELNPLPDHFSYKSILKRQTFTGSFDQAPELVKNYFRAINEPSAESTWRQTYSMMLHLVITLAALTQVQNLEACEGFTFLPHTAASSTMHTRLSMWGFGGPSFRILPTLGCLS